MPLSQSIVKSIEALEESVYGGPWTPAITGLVNVADATWNGGRFAYVDGVVTLSGELAIDPISDAGNTGVTLSLPVAVPAEFQAIGVLMHKPIFDGAGAPQYIGIGPSGGALTLSFNTWTSDAVTVEFMGQYSFVELP